MGSSAVKINMVMLVNLNIGSMFRVTKKFRLGTDFFDDGQLLKLISKNDTTLEFFRLGSDFCDKVSINKKQFFFVLENRPDIFQ